MMKTLRFALLTIILVTLCWVGVNAQLNCSGGWIGCLAITANLVNTSGSLDTVQGIQTTSTPQFIRLGLGTTPSASNPIRINGDACIGSAADTYCFGDVGGGVLSFARGSSYPAGFTFSTSGVGGIFVSGATTTFSVGSAVGITDAKVMVRGNAVLLDGTPTCSGAGCALTAGSINSAGSTTTTTTGAADITITFSANFDHAPSCFANNDTTNNLLRITTVAVGSMHIQGVTVAGDTLRWVCIGN